jgi:glycerophosphoryl diester phosphodiesterase
LRKLDVGAWHGDKFEGRHVSKLTEVYAVMQGQADRRLYLDIKNVDLKQLAAEVKQFNVQQQVILASSKIEIIREWKELVPESDTLNWMGGDEAKLRKNLEELRKTNFAGVTQIQFHVRLKPAAPKDDPFNLPRRLFVEAGDELRKRGILFQALPWDTAEPWVFWTLLDWGVMSFSTDYPDALLKALKEYYARQ